MIYFRRHIKWGHILVAIDQDINIAGLWFEGQKYYPDINESGCFIEESTKDEIDKCGISQNKLKQAYQMIKEFDGQMGDYEAGKGNGFDLPLSPIGSPFRQKVWKELLEIPRGQTTTYGNIGNKIAKDEGKASMSAQAIGGAVGHNPISLIIPCHRVVGAKGQLTGYAGGVDKKIAILQHEGFKIENQCIIEKSV